MAPIPRIKVVIIHIEIDTMPPSVRVSPGRHWFLTRLSIFYSYQGSVMGWLFVIKKILKVFSTDPHERRP